MKVLKFKNMVALFTATVVLFISIARSVSAEDDPAPYTFQNPATWTDLFGSNPDAAWEVKTNPPTLAQMAENSGKGQVMARGWGISSSYGDYAVETDFTYHGVPNKSGGGTSAGRAAGVFVRAQAGNVASNNKCYYLLFKDPQSNFNTEVYKPGFFALYKGVGINANSFNNSGTPLVQSDEYSMLPGDSVHFRIEVKGTQIACKVSNTETGEIITQLEYDDPDSHSLSGGIGMVTNKCAASISSFSFSIVLNRTPNMGNAYAFWDEVLLASLFRSSCIPMWEICLTNRITHGT